MAETHLKELSAEFPPSDLVGSNEAIELQTRAVLALLLDAAPKSFEESELTTNPQQCPNCDSEVDNSRSPYCSDECRETAAFVRQFRNAVNEAAFVNPDKQAALGQKLWFVLGGGYPCRDALVPDKVRLKVLEREGNKCQQCGAKATTIDHSGSG